MAARRRRGRPALPALAVLAAALWALGPTPARAQGSRPDGGAALRITGAWGFSMREGVTGFGVGRDVLSGSVRLTLPRRAGLQPWVQGTRWVRPEFECLPSGPCDDVGWAVHAGVVAPFSADDTRPGVNPYLLAGLGWAFSEDNRFSYTFGLGAAVPVSRRLAPSVEVRWVDLSGIRNVLMVNLGLRLDLF